MNAAQRFLDSLAPIYLLSENSLESGLVWLEYLLRAVPVPALITEADLDWPGPRITAVNQPMQQLTGYSEEELLGQTPRLFQGQNTSREVLDRLKASLKAGRRFWGETINYTKSGTAYWVRWTIVPVYWRGELVRYASFQIRCNDPLSATVVTSRDEPSSTFEMLFEAAEVAIALVSNQQQYVRVNPAYCELVGLKESEILGQQCYLLQHPLTRKDAQYAFDQAFSGNLEPFARTWYFPDFRGQPLHIFTQARLLRNLEGQAYLVITVTNLTKLQQQQESRLAEGRFHLAVEECGLGFWDFNIVTKDLYLSPGWKQILGYTDAELPNVESTFERLVHADDLAAVLQAFDEFASGKRDKYEVTFRMIHKDGSPRWILSRGIALRDDHGKVYRVVGKHTDITELHQAEEMLRHNQRRLTTILRYATDTVLILDAEGRHQFLGERILERYGFDPKESLGQSVFDHIDKEDLDASRQFFGELLKNPGQPRRMELRFLHARGAKHWLDITAINLLQDPAIQGILVTAHDITEQRRLYDQLRQAQKMESLGLLAGGIAHDFNNMLAIILGNAELAQQLALGPQREYLKAISDAAMRAVGLAQQLLGFARKRQLQIRKLNISQLLAESAQLLTFTVGSQIRVVVEPIPEDLPPIRGDLAALQQALVNLGINARDAMPDGGTITLRGQLVQVAAGDRSQQDAYPGTFLRLDVEDTGTGIAPDILPQIFEPFFTTKPAGEGTGLGLAIVYGTVKQLGGWIEVRSSLGQGTCFAIYLPASLTETGFL